MQILITESKSINVIIVREETSGTPIKGWRERPSKAHIAAVLDETIVPI